MTVLCAMAYAGNALEHDRFPETYIFVEGARGSVELGPDYWIRVTTADGTHAKRYSPPCYLWADPAYDVVHASIVPCCSAPRSSNHPVAFFIHRCGATSPRARAWRPSYAAARPSYAARKH